MDASSKNTTVEMFLMGVRSQTTKATNNDAIYDGFSAAPLSCPRKLPFVYSVVDKHHKSTTTLRRRNILVRTYYDHLPFFAFCCIGGLAAPIS